MTKLQTRREWLASQGLAIAGARGKFSNAAKEALAKADAEGYEFLDGPSPTGPRGPVIKSTHPDEKPEPVKPKASDTLYVCPSDFRYPEADYVAVARDENGKRVEYGMRECCNTCKVSLTNHMCENPTILGLIPVKIEARK